MIIKITKDYFKGLDESYSGFSCNYRYHVFGDLYLEKIDDVLDAIEKENFSKLRTLEGDFTIVLLDEKTKKVSIFSDRAGKQNVFYSVKDNAVVISNSFWEIKDFLRLGPGDVDGLSVKQQIFFFSPFGCKTILKNVFLQPAASLTRINLEADSVTRERYWRFGFKDNNLTERDKYDLLDETFLRALKVIREVNVDTGSFGLGLSGGFDSRIIPFYAKEVGIDLEAFTIGSERPRGVLKAYDFNSADKIANWYGLHRKTIDNFQFSLRQQLDVETEFAPEVGSQLFKVVGAGELNSKNLITGASGFIVGASPMYRGVLDNGLVEHTLRFQSILGPRDSFSSIKKALSIVFGARFNYGSALANISFGDLFSQNDMEATISEIESFYCEFGEGTKVERLMNYALFNMGRNNGKGAFESFLGQKRSFSVYNPFFLDVVPYFSKDDLLDRSLFIKFVNYRLPDISEIQGQDFKSARVVNSVILRRAHNAWALSNAILRGSGVMNYSNWVRGNEFGKLSEEVNADFGLLPISKILELKCERQNVHPALPMNILKMKNILSKL